MAERNFNPEKYRMLPCSNCHGEGYLNNPERIACPECRGFGFIVDPRTKMMGDFPPENRRLPVQDR
jgi:DnaJ-class molecular chaperone